MLRNKTAIECWNILKYETESTIEQFVPLTKQGKQSRKKHLSKEAITSKQCGGFTGIPNINAYINSVISDIYIFLCDKIHKLTSLTVNTCEVGLTGAAVASGV